MPYVAKPLAMSFVIECSGRSQQFGERPFVDCVQRAYRDKLSICFIVIATTRAEDAFI